VLKFLSDENFNRDILRGLFRNRPIFDVVRVQDIGLCGIADQRILEWAANNDRVVLTHDRDTMPNTAFERVKAGLPMPGLFLVSSQMPHR
jgi:predicted nuclease of predicted toxin-antitoxin system